MEYISKKSCSIWTVCPCFYMIIRCQESLNITCIRISYDNQSGYFCSFILVDHDVFFIFYLIFYFLRENICFAIYTMSLSIYIII